MRIIGFILLFILTICNLVRDQCSLLLSGFRGDLLQILDCGETTSTTKEFWTVL